MPTQARKKNNNNPNNSETKLNSDGRRQIRANLWLPGNDRDIPNLVESPRPSSPRTVSVLKRLCAAPGEQQELVSKIWPLFCRNNPGLSTIEQNLKGLN